MKTNVAKPIYSITPFTLLDYPDQSACILWFSGCNMRCLYCYNPEIVLGKGSVSLEEALLFLKKRQHLLDAVVFSGGECLLHKDFLNFIKKIKQMGFLIKIDTNGSKPALLQELIAQKLIDYVALDFKALAIDFEKITQSTLFSDFEKSLEILIQNTVEFEVRTTVHSDLISEKTVQSMIFYLENHDYNGNYYLQYFVNGLPTLEKLGYSKSNLNAQNLSTKTIRVAIRA